MKYVLVQWSSGNIKTSILTENYVRDKTMLYDCTKEGIISFLTVQRGDVSTIKSKGKLGRIACVSDDRKLLEEHQSLLLLEDSELIEEDENMDLALPSKQLKLINEMDHNSEEQKAFLQNKLEQLNKELIAEKNRVKELLTLNQKLQLGLPDLLSKAMQSSKFITSSRTSCLTCRQSYNNTLSDLPSTDVETGRDEYLTASNGSELMSLPIVSHITSKAHTIHTSRLNTPAGTVTSHVSMLNSPSIVSIHSNGGSPQSGGDFDLSLPSMTSPNETDNTLPIISSSETLRSVALEMHPENQESYSTLLSMPQSPQSTMSQGSFRKLTLAMMTHYFDKDILRMSSVTGQGKDSRKALDKEIVKHIIDTVQKRFPGTKARQIKATMAQKCKYIRQVQKKKLPPSMIHEKHEL